MPTRRQYHSLGATLEWKVASYSMVGAAGLSILSATNATAAVVYTSVREMGEGQAGHEAFARIDLNHDGITDFEIVGIFDSVEGSQVYYRDARVYGLTPSGNKMAVVSSYPVIPSAKALSLGREVGPRLKFSSGHNYGIRLAGFVSLGAGPQSAAGQFYNQRNKFIALKLSLDGETYYGWARISTQEVGNKLSFELIDYAYQSTPNLPILAGQGIPKPATASVDSTTAMPELDLLAPGPEEMGHPAALGLLAYGSEALPAWRPRNAQTR